MVPSGVPRLARLSLVRLQPAARSHLLAWQRYKRLMVVSNPPLAPLGAPEAPALCLTPL